MVDYYYKYGVPANPAVAFYASELTGDGGSGGGLIDAIIIIAAATAPFGGLDSQGIQIFPGGGFGSSDSDGEVGAIVSMGLIHGYNDGIHYGSSLYYVTLPNGFWGSQILVRLTGAPTGATVDVTVQIGYAAAGSGGWSTLSERPPVDSPLDSTIIAPTALAATLVDTHVHLSWSDNSDNELGFMVERSDDGGAHWIQVGGTPANIATFDDYAAGVAVGDHSYRVYAYKADRISGYSNTDIATVDPPSDMLTVVSVDPGTGGILGFDPVTINGSGFLDGATVTFDGDDATDVVVVSSTEITCVTPAHAAGAVDVVVTNP